MAMLCLSTVFSQCPIVGPEGVYDPKDDILITSYHQSIARTETGYITWGEDMASNGTSDPVMQEISPANGYNYTGSIVQYAVSGNSGGQAFLLTTTNLYAWGYVNEVVNSNFVSGTAFAPMALPGGVAATDVIDLFATSNALVITTSTGGVWVASNQSRVSGNTSTNTAIWQEVQTSAGVPLTDVFHVTGSDVALYALQNDGDIYVWGNSVYLGDGNGASNYDYATLMTAPSSTPTYISAFFNDTDTQHGILALGTDQKVYGVGHNTANRIINETTNAVLNWETVKYNGGAEMTNVLQISTNQTSEQYSSAAAIVDGATVSDPNVLYTWGSDNSGNIGHGNAGTVEYPSVPGGYTVGSDDAIYVSVGGHATTIYNKSTKTICFTGHVTNNSTGGLTGATATTFVCITVVNFDLCGVNTCLVDSISASNLSVCNDNGTNGNSADDTFTADITVTFSEAPTTGTLDLSGDGTASVAIGSLDTTSSHTFTGVTLPANGIAISLTATFSDEVTCTFSNLNVVSAPASCSIAPIVANDDSATGVNGVTGATGVIDVFTNDTLNGVAVNPSDVTLTETIADPNGYLTLNGDGTIDVAAGTPAGTYQLTYQICEVLNPTNCDTAVASVTVDAAPIVANDDSATGVNGVTGATGVIDVFTNDTLNGVAVNPSDVTLTETIADPNGYLTLNGDGTIDVAAGTPAGTYQLTYQICEVLNPTNCDTAVASVTVDAAPIVANDDSATGVNGVTGATGVIDVFTNDTLNGVAVNPSDVTLTETIADPNGYLTLNGDGTIDVAAGTPAGTYQLTYQICEVLNPTNCDTAVASVTVDAAPIVANDDSATGVNGVTGATGVIDVFTNDTLNGVAVNPSDVTLTETIADPNGYLTLNGDGTIDVGAGTPAGTYQLTYQICEVLNPTNCDTAVASVTVDAAPIVANDDSATGVNGVTGATGVIDVFTNDTLNGVAVNPSDVTLTETIADPNGYLTLNGDGIIDVAAGTPAGTYQLTYQICEVLNPTNCDTAVASVTVDAAPIVANDDSATGVNGVTGATGVIDVFTNDTLNGVAVNPSDVTLTETIADPNGYLTLNGDGTIDVAAGTPAGTYQLTYQICEVLNPTNCDTAVASVTVDAAPIVANDDSATGVNGVTGATGVIDVFTNDTLNGVAVNPSDVTLTETIADPNGYLTLNGDGTIDVAAGTPAGTYQLTYQICEVLNPTNCDTAVASVTVDAAPIVANDDSATGVNGVTGATGVIDVFTNDTLNGVAVNPSDVTLTETIADPNGYLTLNGDGTIDVAAGTPAGTYQLTYQICEVLNPTNCDTAVASVTVDAAPIVANDDSATGVNGVTGATGVIDVFTNDTLNGVAVNPSDVTLTETIADPNGYLTLNGDGTIDVAAGTPAGTYQLTYQICEVLNPTNCDTAVASVTVDAAPIVANDDSATGVNGVTGATGVIDVFTNDTLNGVAVNPSDVTLTETIADPNGYLTLNGDGTIDVGAGTPAGTYQLTYQICEVLNPTNCDTAVASVTVDAAPIVANDDSATGVNGVTGATGVIDVFTNDTLNGVAVNPSDVTLTETIADPNGYLTLNGDGTIDVAAGTPAGTYQLTYQICEVLNPTNCDTAVASVTVGDCVDFGINDCDGDGIINSNEVTDGTDPLDNCDFVLASQTVAPDTAWNNADCDGDGVTNETEVTDGTDPLDNCDFVLASQTVTPDTAWNNADCDGDGVTNETEVTDGTDPLDNCDFVLASQTVTPDTAWNNADCDGDGVTNETEVTDGTDPLDNCDFVLASQTVTPDTAWNNADCDGDGVTNETEVTDGTDPLDNCDFVLASQTVTPDTAWNNADCDGDGVTNETEVTDGTDPLDNCDFVLASQTVTPDTAWNNADCDGDGVTNETEVTDGTDPLDNCDFVLASQTVTPDTAWNNADCDGDGVTNETEVTDGTDPLDNCDFVLASQTVAPDTAWNNADCDGDGVTNETEVTDGTDPLDNCDFVLASQTVTPDTAWNNADCDGDGVTNETEVTDGTDPLDNCDFVLASQTVTPDTAWNNADCDGDGVTNETEVTDGTDPLDNCDFVLASQTVTPDTAWNNADCDGDGVTNETEVTDGTDPLDNCDFVLASQTVTPDTAWNNADCDGDGVTNETEVTDGTDPLDNCDFVLASQTVTPDTAWNNADCDGDGVTNETEVTDGTDPLDNCDFVLASQTVTPDTAWNNADCDGDGVTNETEVTDGTDPLDNCDFVLASQTVTPDTAWNNADCDGDGVTNETEVTDGTDPLDNCDFVLASQTVTPDTAWNNADCDGDGVTNETEVTDGTDPLDNCDFVLASQTVTPDTAWNNADCDGDGVTNETEVTDGTDPLDNCDFVLASQTVTPDTAWNNADCDGDGVTNETEVTDGTDPLDNCDFVLASQTVTPDTAWNNADCDGDGVTNETEVTDGTDPLDNCDFVLASQTVTPDTAWNNADCDGDGVTNETEVTDGTDPLDNCDFVLASQTVTPDTAWNNADCDGDGVTNETEVTDGTDPLDNCDFVLASQTVTPDTAWNNADCDGDGVTNETEVTDGTDPLDSCSYIPSSITGTVTATADCTAAIEVTKMADMFGNELGDVITYTITVENIGNVTLTNVTLVDLFTDVNGVVYTLTQEPTFDSADLGSIEGTLLVGEIGTYYATFEITQQAINAGGVINSVIASAIAPNQDIVEDTSDNGDDFDGNTEDDETVTELGCLMMFNEFSPNGDGVNEFLVINCIHNYPNNKLEVYNRWGNIVYEKRGYNNDWNGTSNGRSVYNGSEDLPVGTYYYILNLGDGTKPKTGWIYINR